MIRNRRFNEHKSLRDRRFKESSILLGPHGEQYSEVSSRQTSCIPENIKKFLPKGKQSLKESRFDDMEWYDILEEIKEELGCEETLEAITRAMDKWELKDLLLWIINTYELDYNEDDE